MVNALVKYCWNQIESVKTSRVLKIFSTYWSKQYAFHLSVDSEDNAMASGMFDAKFGLHLQDTFQVKLFGTSVWSFDTLVTSKLTLDQTM